MDRPVPAHGHAFAFAFPATAALTAIAAFCVAGPAFAWSNHALNTRAAIEHVPEFARLEPVRVESLDSFVAAQAGALEAVLDAQEAWSRAHVPTYPPRPDALRFSASGAPAPQELRRRFVAALRIAPDARLALFLKDVSADDAAGRPSLPRDRVSTLADEERDDAAAEESDDDAAGSSGNAATQSPFVALREGEAVSPLAVVATASDEPDYGLDINVWEDNDTEHGRAYRFGRQPFGNPALDFGTQAPFHMGFYDESAVIYAAAGFLKRTYPEHRIHLYRTLALHALRTGHEYWGWRFAGWAMHYIQDLAQPYHARVLPGVSTVRMLWINALDIAGWPDAKNRAITLVSNRHLALENFQRTALVAEHRDAARDGPLIRALAGKSGDDRLHAGDDRPHANDDRPRVSPGEPAASERPVFGENDPRALVARRAAQAAGALDHAVASALPSQYVDDPEFEFGVDAVGIDLHAQLAGTAPAARDAMVRALVPSMREFGVHSRAFVRTMLAARNTPRR